MELYKSGVAYAAGSLMLQWSIMKNRIHGNPGDTVHVFINFESILRNLSMQKHLHDLVNFHKQKMVLDIEASILNLVANYRMYFLKEKCVPKIYLYHTSLNKTTQQMYVYNKYYRNYYFNRYLQNPQFRDVGKVMVDTVIPDIKLILSYVQNCYFVESDTYDGSIIPSIITKPTQDPAVIITADVFDTMYLFNPSFQVLYIKSRYPELLLASSIEECVRYIIKEEDVFDLALFNAELYYRLLISVKGSQIRNIKSARSFGYGKFIKAIKAGIDKQIVLKDFSAISSIIEIFPEKYRDDIRSAFLCSGIDTQYDMLSKSDIDKVFDQLIDRIDPESIEALNNQRFLDFPINIQGLIYT